MHFFQAFFQGLDNSNIQAAVLGIGILIVFLVLMRRVTKKSRVATHNSPDAQKPGQKTDRRNRQPLRGEAGQLLVELQEFGREIEGRLETRIIHLTKLISEADRVIEKLNAAVSVSVSREEGEFESDKKKESRQGKTLLKEQILTLSEEGVPPAEIAGIVEKPLGEVELYLGLGKKSEAGRKKD